MAIIFWVKFTQSNTSFLVFHHKELVNSEKMEFKPKNVTLKKAQKAIVFQLNYVCESGFDGESCSYCCNGSVPECQTATRHHNQTTPVSSAHESKRKFESTLTDFRSQSTSRSSAKRVATKSTMKKLIRTTFAALNNSSSTLTNFANTPNEASKRGSTSRLPDMLRNRTNATNDKLVVYNDDEPSLSIVTTIIATGVALGATLIVSVVVMLVRKARKYAPTAADLSQSLSFITPRLSATGTSVQNAVYYEYDDGQSLIAAWPGDSEYEYEYATLTSKLSRWKRRRSTSVASVLTDAFADALPARPDRRTFNAARNSEHSQHVYHILHMKRLMAADGDGDDR